MSAEAMTQLGAGVAIAYLSYLTIREMLAFLSKKKNGNHSGEKTIDFWRAEIATAVLNALSMRAMPLLEELKGMEKANIEIIREKLHENNKELTEILTHMQLALELIKSRL